MSARWAQHRHILRRQSERLLAGLEPSNRCNRHLLFSWAKYGEAVFEFVVVEECEVEDLTARESAWLDLFRDTYGFQMANTEGPTDNPMRGQRHKPESIAKMRAWSKAFVRTTEHKKRIGDAHRGKTLSPEQKHKISLRRRGVAMPSIRGDKNPSKRPEARERMRTNNPLKNPEALAKLRERIPRKTVVDVNSGESWQSLSACAIELGVSVQAISRHLYGLSKKCANRVLQMGNPADYKVSP